MCRGVLSKVVRAQKDDSVWETHRFMGLFSASCLTNSVLQLYRNLSAAEELIAAYGFMPQPHTCKTPDGFLRECNPSFSFLCLHSDSGPLMQQPRTFKTPDSFLGEQCPLSLLLYSTCDIFVISVLCPCTKSPVQITCCSRIECCRQRSP